MSTGRSVSQHALPKSFLYFQLQKLMLNVSPIKVLGRGGTLVYKPAKDLSVKSRFWIFKVFPGHECSSHTKKFNVYFIWLVL